MRRREFIVGAAAFGGVPFVRLWAAERTPLWTAGIMTDTHVKRTRESCELVDKACKLFAKRGIDLFVHCGDIATNHYPEVYPILREITDAAFPEKPAHKIWVYANHDHVGRKNEPFETVMADVKRLLGGTNGFFDLIEFKGSPIVVIPQLDTYPAGEGFKKVADLLEEAERRHADGPVFLFMHVPPKWTIDRSGRMCATMRKLLAEHPRVITVSGHVHGTLLNERNIWQGEFTAVSAGCLAIWGGGYKATGVLIMEVYADRVVFRRFDVLTGEEYGADDPWVIPQPFDSKTAPYVPSRRAAKAPLPQYADGAALKAAADSPFTAVMLTVPEAEGSRGTYRHRVEVLDSHGVLLSTGSFYGQFHLAASERKTELSYRLSAAYFEEGREYVLRVTPMNFFLRGGRPLEVKFVAPQAVVKEVRFLCEEPMEKLSFRRGLFNKSVKLNAKDGWYPLECDRYKLVLPKNVWRGKNGTRFRFSIDLEIEQDEETPHLLMLRSLSPMSTAYGPVMTAGGKPGRLRYVMEFKKPKAEYAYDLVLGDGTGGRVRFNRVLVEKI